MDSSFSITCTKLLVPTAYKMYQHTMYILHNLQELTNTCLNKTLQNGIQNWDHSWSGNETVIQNVNRF